MRSWYYLTGLGSSRRPSQTSHLAEEKDSETGLMAVHAGMKQWSEVEPYVVTKDVAPGWNGPSTEKTLEAWRGHLVSWARTCSYGDDHGGRVVAVEFRVPTAIKDNIRVFPSWPGGPAAARTVYLAKGDDVDGTGLQDATQEPVRQIEAEVAVRDVYVVAVACGCFYRSSVYSK